MDVEELVYSPMSAAGEASSSSIGAMACFDKWSKELVDHGVVSAEKAEGFELMARFVRDVCAVQVVDTSKKEVDGVASFVFGTVRGGRCRVDQLDVFR